MKFEIKNRFTGSLIFECEAASWKIAIELAIEKKADLRSADLRSADLSFANLRSADLRSADLRFADLSFADLSFANLRSANLSSANLRFADLSSANLSSANLSSANLSSANLSSANLRFADLAEIKTDFFDKIAKAENEIIGLFKSLWDGKVEGSCYEGECACFVGTIANVRGVQYEELNDLVGLEADPNSPTERWFMGINKGDTPQNNPVSKITVDWIVEFCEKESIKLPERKVSWE